jgi:hypothetical protein
MSRKHSTDATPNSKCPVVYTTGTASCYRSADFADTPSPFPWPTIATRADTRNTNCRNARRAQGLR